MSVDAAEREARWREARLVERLASALRPPPAGDDGEPTASPEERRLARAVTVLATAWMACVALWEAFGPVRAGHDAASASVGIIADNMLRWRIAAPVWVYTDAQPTPAQYYCHHPWGIFWTTTALRALVGRHDVVLRLAPMLLSIATPPLVAALGRALFGPLAGAAAALAFVCLPIALAFAQFNALEVPLIAWSALLLWGWVRHWQCGRARYLVAALVGALGAMNADWPAFVLVAWLLGLELARALAGRGGSVPRLAALGALGLAVGGGYLWLFHSLGRLDDLLAAGALRSRGAAAPLTEVLASRRLWIEVAFSPIALLVGAFAVPGLGLRALAARRLDDLLPLGVFAAAAFQYLVFRQGADVHFFWPHLFALHAALAFGALAATLRAPLEAWFGPRAPRARLAGALPLAATALLLAPVLRDGILALGWARRTGGRFDEKGLAILDDGDRLAALRHFDARLPRDARVALGPSTSPHWAQIWALGGRTVELGPVDDVAVDATIVDLRYLPPAEVATLARRGAVDVVGPLALVEHRAPRGLREVWRLDERAPGWADWLFVSAHEPERAPVVDPFLRWEVAGELGLSGPAPPEPPATREQLRVTHALALARGEAAAAEHALGALRVGLTPLEARFDGGTELLGYVLDRGEAARATVYLRAGGPLPRGVRPRVRALVEAGAPLSLTMTDPKPREVAAPGFPSPERWRAGRVYAVSFDLLERPGTERFELSLSDARGVERRLPEAGGERVLLFRY